MDTREFKEEHWKRIQSVNQNMMFYVALTEFADPSRKPSDKVVKLREVAQRDASGLLRKRDVPRIFWSGLERIYERIYEDIQRTVLTEQYDWTKGLTEKQ